MELVITLTVKQEYADADFDPAITDEQLEAIEEPLQELTEAVRETLYGLDA